MGILRSPCLQGCWQNMAVVEVDEGENLAEILDDISFDSWLDQQPALPGKARYALMVNTARGSDRAAMATHALLSALKSIADSGALSGFAIVAGSHWLQKDMHPGSSAATYVGNLSV